MTRLVVAGEGLTEVDFVTRILKPHLEALSGYSIAVSAPNLRGYRTYAKLTKSLKRLLDSPSPELRVSTMIDLFKLPGDFPGRQEYADHRPLERVQHLERNLAADIDDRRFVPYLQLHEFEALLLVDLPELVHQHPNRRSAIAQLAAQLERDFASPEHVNALRPPSYWVTDAVPEYNKRLDGVATVERIGLTRLRHRCRHFAEWLESLERPTNY